jgi:hypothetical protein
MLAILVAGTLTGCSTVSTKAAGFTRVAIQPDRRSGVERVRPDMDEGIARDLDAAFLRNNLHVEYAIGNRIVTLTGHVSSQSKRVRAERVAAAVVNVQQVVDELLVRTRTSRFSD